MVTRGHHLKAVLVVLFIIRHPLAPERVTNFLAVEFQTSLAVELPDAKPDALQVETGVHLKSRNASAALTVKSPWILVVAGCILTTKHSAKKQDIQTGQGNTMTLLWF